MANVTITDLQTVTTVTDSMNLPCDDGSVTQRMTMAQLWSYVTGKYAAFTSITAAGTVLTSSMKIILLDPTSASFVQALPAVASLPAGLKYQFKIVAGGGNTVTLDGNSTELIDSAQTLILNSAPTLDSITLMNTGTKWLIM